MTVGHKLPMTLIRVGMSKPVNKPDIYALRKALHC